MTHHVIISGTGRAGSTFVMELLTRLGLDTGFPPDDITLDPLAHAGLEYFDVPGGRLPYILKSPWLMTDPTKVLENADIHVDHAIIPIRPFAQAAASRVHVQRLAAGADFSAEVPGGLWLTTDPGQQVGVLQRQFANLFEVLAAKDIPVSLLWYPRLVRDSRYLFGKLHFLLKDVDWEQFDTVFHATVRPEWVHDSFDDDLTDTSDA